MRFPPQAEKEVAVETGELAAAMDPHVAAEAQSNAQRRPVAAGTAVMHDQPGSRQTQLAAAVAAEHLFAMAAEATFGMPAAVIAAAAEPAGEEFGAAAGPAPPGGLFRHPGRRHHASLPCQFPESTRIHSSGSPLSTPAAARELISAARRPSEGEATEKAGATASIAESSAIHRPNWR